MPNYTFSLCSRSSEWVVVGSPALSRSSGKVFFELEVVEAVGEVFVGYAGTNFRAEYIGADEASWALCNDGDPKHK